jgi:hypothetical protein
MDRSIDLSSFSIPENIQNEIYLAKDMAWLLLKTIKISSIRYELGVMSKDEATGILDFAYIPIRYRLGHITWENSDERISNPRVWSFEEYYKSLENLSSRYNPDVEKRKD